MIALAAATASWVAALDPGARRPDRGRPAAPGRPSPPRGPGRRAGVRPVARRVAVGEPHVGSPPRRVLTRSICPQLVQHLAPHAPCPGPAIRVLRARAREADPQPRAANVDSRPVLHLGLRGRVRRALESRSFLWRWRRRIGAHRFARFGKRSLIVAPARHSLAAPDRGRGRRARPRGGDVLGRRALPRARPHAAPADRQRQQHRRPGSGSAASARSTSARTTCSPTTC